MHLTSLVEGITNYGNPFHIAVRRLIGRNGEMWIADRASGVRVRATVRSYQMFGETWYLRDYDISSCPIREDDVIIDIGANQGFFSCYAASKGAYVHAFEPFVESYTRLKANIEINSFSSRIAASQVAVSPNSGRSLLYSSPQLGGGANTLVEEFGKNLDQVEANEVETKTLDDILDEIASPVRLCKMDCEGSELGILGALKSASRVESFAIEFHPRGRFVQDLISVILGWGTHQVSFGRANTWMIYAVRTDTLLEYSKRFNR